MDPRLALRRAILLALVATCALFTGCEYRIVEYTKQPATTKTCDLNDVIVHVEWVKDIDAIAAACGETKKRLGDCAKVWTDARGLRRVDVWAMKPRDFDDAAVLAYLGHAVCHGLDGTHL